MDMQIGGFQDAQMGLIGGRMGRERVQRDKASAACKKMAARELDWHVGFPQGCDWMIYETPKWVM